MASFPKRAYVVSHTHWDREWYLPYHRFRTNMVGVVQKVLDALENDDAFEHFVLDGQAILLEDYFEVRPDDRDRIRRLAGSGALVLGPWYILPDEFLVSGEATIRNLMAGHEAAGALGPVQKVGYMPDSFGHIAQMPQILRRAGIDSFIYTRGNGDEIDELGHEYVWRAPDGSEVLAVNQCGGYCNAAGLGLEEIWHSHTARSVDTELAVRQIGKLFEKMRPLSRSAVVLLNNGCDHFPPQRDPGAVLEALRGAFPETEFVHSTFAEFVEALRAEGPDLRTYSGELRGGRHHHILSGVWSSRMYLKQQNERAQTLLESCVEPMAASAHFLHGIHYPAGELDRAWRLLLRNHPHDSICGCSTDEVHDEMEARFAGVVQTCDQLARNVMGRLAPSFGERTEDDIDTTICVFNTLPERRTAFVERVVVLTPEAWGDGRLELVDDEGRSVPFAVRDLRFLERFWGIDYRTELGPEEQRLKLARYLESFGDRIVKSEGEGGDVFVTLQFEARDLPAVGHRTYTLRRSPRADVLYERTTDGPVKASGGSMENESLRVVLHPDGTFDLTDLRTGRTHGGLNVLEDTGDVGDEYDYSAAAAGATVSSAGLEGKVRVTENTGLAAALETDFVMELPKSVTADRQSRSTTSVECRVRVALRVTAGSPLVAVELEFDNRALDHRLRALFPTGIRSSTVVSDGHFMLNERPIERPDGADWVQPPPGTLPQQGFTLASDGSECLAVLNRGLPEIEATKNDDGCVTLALTLLRCVGWLSRDDFESRRRSNAGPTLHTPGAQCRGRRSFRYAVCCPAEPGAAPSLARESARFRSPVATKQGVAPMTLGSGGSLVELAPGACVVTAIKKHGTRDTLIVRLYNSEAAERDAELTFSPGVSSAWRTDLLEERTGETAVLDGGLVRLRLGPHEIATLEVAPETRARSPIDGG